MDNIDFKNIEEFQNFFYALDDKEVKELFKLFNLLANKNFANSSNFSEIEEKEKIIKEYLDKMQAINYINKTAEKADFYNCTKCNNKGIYYYISFEGKYYINMQAENIFCKDREAFKINSIKCHCEKIREGIKQIKKDGLYKLLKRKHLENFTTEKPFQKQIKELALKYIEEIKKGGFQWFFIGGQTGAGKTHICTGIINKLIKSGLNCRFFDYVQKMDALKRLQFIDSENFQNALKEFKISDILYIDDFFFANVTDADLKIMFEIINYRYNNDLPCIISSEKILEEIINITGSIGGRIKESAEGFFIKIFLDNENNYRLK